MLAMEKETLGMYISGHPLAAYRVVLNRLATVNTAEVAELPDDSDVILGGLISGIKRVTTRRGDAMAILTVEDLIGTIEVVVFPRQYQKSILAMRVDEVVLVKGKVKENGEGKKIIADELTTLAAHLGGELHLKLDSQQSQILEYVKLVLTSFKGDASVFSIFQRKEGYQSREILESIVRRGCEQIGRAFRLPAKNQSGSSKMMQKQSPEEQLRNVLQETAAPWRCCAKTCCTGQTNSFFSILTVTGLRKSLL